MNNLDAATFFYKSPLGILQLVTRGGMLLKLLFEMKEKVSSTGNSTEFQKEIFIQLNEYFSGVRKKFDLPALLSGTIFEKKVYRELLEIPYGETISYKSLAENIGHPKSHRAVGNALKKNSLPIIVPCHRVIGSRGNLGGYSGGVARKIELLKIEGVCRS